ncbi:MAG: hypothetical protein SFY69_07750 [Planctomycetota bacterium]|nr:hypothetical protein [Planctomycetota bacterium]
MRHARRSAARSFVLCAGVAAGLASWAHAQVEPSIIREGEGPRRAELNTRELKAFDFAAFASLKDWTNGAALTAGDAAGKPVLILTWTDYVPQSKRGLVIARRMAEQHAAKGLIVVCVHAPSGWDKVAKGAAPEGSTFLLAHDADGGFRRALSSDVDPDFYVIDRAGQLRYADIATESVEAACAAVVAESREDAAAINDRLKADAAKRDADLRRTAGLRERVDLTSLPEIPFTEPTPDEYKKAKWPAPPKDPNEQPSATGEPVEPDLPRVALSDSNFFPAKPQLKGRITLLYFWHPESRFTFQGMDRFDLLQRQRGRDLNVVGCLSPLKDNSGGELKMETDPKKLREKLEEFQKARVQGHSIFIDADGGIFQQAQKFYNNSALPLPWVAILSSDGVMRWWGWIADPKGQAAFDRIFEVDPGVLARRAAEAAYIRSKEGQ